MRRTRRLSTRLLAAIGTFAVLYLTVFVVLLTALHELRDADREARDAARVTLAATGAREGLAELHAAERGIAIAGAQPRLLAAWRRDAAVLRERAGELAAADAGSLAAQLRAYVDDVSAPLVTTARTSPARARARIAHTVLASPAQAVRARLGALIERVAVTRRDRRDRASSLAQVAQVVGTVGVLATLLGALGFLVYVRRTVMTPLRRVADAARALAAGDLHARVADRSGVGEVAELAQTFDRMAASLEESRAVLEHQNAELAGQSVELVEAVRSAREGASMLRAVLDATPDAIALLDRKGAVLVDNPPMRAVREAFEADADALDEHGGLVPHDADGAAAERRDEIALRGTSRTFARYAAPVRDGRGRLIGRLLVLREITGEREVERAKEDFFALVSHELRTPLTAILGYVELVLAEDETTLADEPRHHLAVVERNAQRLLRLVGDLLFAAQIERGALLLEAGAVDLPQLVRDATALARPRAEESEIALETQIDGVPPCLGDRDRLAQVLDNLLSNALKFTPPGGRIAVRLSAREGMVRLEVEDTGVGILQKDLPHLFDRFYRATNATTRAVPGLGLGLMIVRAIVEGHDGTVAVRSEVGAGTTFTVSLPLSPVPAVELPGAERYPAGGR